MKTKGAWSARFFFISRITIVLFWVEVFLGFASAEFKDGFGKQPYRVFSSIGGIKPINGGAVDGVCLGLLITVALMVGFNTLGRAAGNNARNATRKQELIMNVINALGVQPTVQDLEIAEQIWNYIQSFMNKQEKAQITQLCDNIGTTVDFNDQDSIKKWAQQVVDVLQPVLDRNKGINLNDVRRQMSLIAQGESTFRGGVFRQKAK